MDTSACLEDVEADNIPEIEEVSFPCDGGALLRVLEATLERQHQNIFSSIAQFRVANRMQGAHALVIRRSGKVASVFLFRIEGDRALIMNEAVKVDNDDLLRAVRHLFGNFKPVAVICWRAIQTDIARLPFPFQRFNYSEDIVVTLPPTEHDYLTQLGKATRKNLQRHRNRLNRDHPGLRVQVRAGQDIQESDIRRIVEFNRARMSGKHKACGFHEQEVRRLIDLSRTHGMLLTVSIGDRLCAGAICHRVGANYFMEISAHDPAYDGYRMGTLCCYLAICEAIARGGREMHLLWGRDAYKFLLLGQPRELDNVLVYRSRKHMLMHGGLVLRSALSALRRNAKLQAHAVAGGDAVRLARGLVELLRSVKHFRPHRA
jgi:hypothetical protein